MAGKGNPNWIAGGPSPNPSGKARTDTNTVVGNALARVRRDGYLNPNTGLGVRGRDKTVGTTFCADVIDPWTAEEIYRGDSIAARLVDMIPDDACSEEPELCVGETEAPDYFDPEADAQPAPRTDARSRESWQRRVVRAFVRDAKGDRDVDDSKTVSEEIAHKFGRGELNVMGAISQALKWKRSAGGSAILIGANDYTTDLRQPLALDRVRGLNCLTPLEARELAPLAVYDDPWAPKFGQVALYQLTPWQDGKPLAPGLRPGIVQIHESRLLVFQGTRVTRRQAIGALNGWGDNIFTRVGAALQTFASGVQNVGVLLSDFAQAVYKMKGLAAALLQNPNALSDAMLNVDMMRSICRAIIIDEGEEFERKSTSLAGYPEMIDRLAANVTAVAGIPHTRLWGTSAKGLNATGEGDDRMYFGGVSRVQTHEVAPAYLKLVEIEMSIRGLDPASTTHALAFKPLWQPSELEVAQMRKSVADTDKIYIETGVVSAEEVALNRFGGDGYSSETRIDIEARKQQMAVLPPVVNTFAEEVPEEGLDENGDPIEPDAEGDTSDGSSYLDHSDPLVAHGPGWVWTVVEHMDKFNTGQPRGPNGKWVKGGGHVPKGAPAPGPSGARGGKAVLKAPTKTAQKKAGIKPGSAFAQKIATHAATGNHEAAHALLAKAAELKAADKVAKAAKAADKAAKATEKARAKLMPTKTAMKQAGIKPGSVFAAKIAEHAANGNHEAAHALVASAAKLKAAKAAKKTEKEQGGAKPLTTTEYRKSQAQFEKRITPDQHYACITYSTERYKDINGELRGNKPIKEGKSWTHEKQAETVKNLDAALDKGRSSRAIVTYRGAADVPGGPMHGMRPGDTFHDPGFMSTSQNTKIAKEFAEGAPSGGVLFHITTPAGTRAAPIPSEYAKEREVLIGRGATLSVTRREELPGGAVIIHATVTGTNPP